ncbi:leucyl/phenylalanyl-tRNA--protein transferase [Rhodobaculum claviforme]|uniref:Leucyl/phenylalanyl-tRNA--protein transferase n=1 Tax=Rhodobaculum claviforme TaxID=1549854 RepID=A0A934TMS9_9RHOB|nr:leucyl/phenylalanyl-tRNA--protein transferase [Rhodobaculum claviforme]MBK5927903.1 leucyl/phenylalanyl-tRNA--protein transferase [Rhodobaculum claviforme]
MEKIGLSPEVLLRAYAAGVFPMAEGRHDPALHWIDPARRGVLPLDGFHLSRSLRRRLLRAPWRVSVDTAFADVMRGCADRPETWINAPIFELSCALHDRGHAHSVEVWEGADLVGGVYGVALGAAFFAESMFSRRTDASKAALAWLVDRLRIAGFMLCDTQFLTPHLHSLGGVEVPRAIYRRRLALALGQPADFSAPPIPGPQALVQRISQTSKRG